jgi:hypothetical protein
MRRCHRSARSRTSPRPCLLNCLSRMSSIAAEPAFLTRFAGGGAEGGLGAAAEAEPEAPYVSRMSSRVWALAAASAKGSGLQLCAARCLPIARGSAAVRAGSASSDVEEYAREAEEAGAGRTGHGLADLGRARLEIKDDHARLAASWQLARLSRRYGRRRRACRFGRRRGLGAAMRGERDVCATECLAEGRPRARQQPRSPGGAAKGRPARRASDAPDYKTDMSAAGGRASGSVRSACRSGEGPWLRSFGVGGTGQCRRRSLPQTKRHQLH